MPARLSACQRDGAGRDRGASDRLKSGSKLVIANGTELVEVLEDERHASPSSERLGRRHRRAIE